MNTNLSTYIHKIIYTKILEKSLYKCYHIHNQTRKVIFMKILAIGDIVGRCGQEFIQKKLWDIRKRLGADFVIANGENASVGNGIDKSTSELLFMSGVDVITGGNHTFKKYDVYSYLDDNDRILRPANYPASCPGSGYCTVSVQGVRIMCMNLLGNVYLESLESPFTTAERILQREKGSCDICICDFHAEATSEKYALGYHFDGKINILFGTHTHVQTNDARVMPKGTGYVTDIGMTGPYDSILGVKKEIIIEKFLTKMPKRFEEAQGETLFNAVLFDIDTDTKKINDITLINEMH